MSHRRIVHDLKGLVQSFHSLIVIETVEEDRVRALMAEVATDLRLPMLEWSVTQGLSRVHGALIVRTQDALSCLQHIRTNIDFDAVFLLKDLGPHLTNASVARTLRELAQKLESSRSAIVLTGDPVELPKEIEGMAVRFDLELPDEEDLRSVIRSAVDAMARRQQVHVDLSREDAQKLVGALSGLTVNQARQVICQAIVEDGALTVDDIQRVSKIKGDIVQIGRAHV